MVVTMYMTFYRDAQPSLLWKSIFDTIRFDCNTDLFDATPMSCYHLRFSGNIAVAF